MPLSPRIFNRSLPRIVLCLWTIILLAGVSALASPLAPTMTARSLFVERGYRDADVTTKIDRAFTQLFHGNDAQTIYYEVGSDMAYIKDVYNGDVRSEGMSYGMMICVVLDKKTEFDKLWKWAKTYMLNKSGEWRGCFAWRMNTQGTAIDPGTAPDGEEYIATALFFAAKKWNQNSYATEANAVLSGMLHHYDSAKLANQYTQHTSYFNAAEKKIVFSPFSTSATFTDPSYHLPAFYKLWSLWASGNNQFWSDAADSSRAFFKRCAKTQNSLMPERAFFSGAPNANGGNFDQFLYDAWRIGMNIGVDYAWWGVDSWQKTYANTLLRFFYGKGIKTYPDRYLLDGTALYTDHSPGLVATNAVAAFAATDTVAGKFVDELWNLPVPSGTHRYYNGCLYLLSMLHAGGRFYPPGLASSTRAFMPGPSAAFTVRYGPDAAILAFPPGTPGRPQIVVTDLRGIVLRRIDAGTCPRTVRIALTGTGARALVVRVYEGQHMTAQPVVLVKPQ